MVKLLIVGDLQMPHHDPRAVRAMLHFARDFKPDITIDLGDLLDFGYLAQKSLWRAEANPERILNDLDAAYEYLHALEKVSKRVVFIEGNHEDRLRKYILENAPSLSVLADEDGPLNLHALLTRGGRKLSRTEIVGPYGEAFVYESIVFKHGDSHAKNAAATELADEGSSGVSGHVHRFAMATRTDRKGAHAWYSNGCLCHIKGPNMPPGYRGGETRVRNWQQGFIYGYVTPREDAADSGNFNLYPVVITDGRFTVNGRNYSPDGRY